MHAGLTQPEMPTDLIPLEDDPCDVIAKAIRGLGMTSKILAEKSNLSTEEVDSALAGEIVPDSLNQIAAALTLSPSALTGLSSYTPNAPLPVGLHRFVTPFGHAGVNAYVITHGQTATVFDTGTNAQPIIDFLLANKLQPEAIYITHRHADHTAGVDSFGSARIIYPEELEHGSRIKMGTKQLTILDVSGHMHPARAFFYEGLGSPVCIVGDSIFAGSMGGTTHPSKYQLALRTARNNILTLPPVTTLCPGHGPLTTVNQELLHNPFLANI